MHALSTLRRRSALAAVALLVPLVGTAPSALAADPNTGTVGGTVTRPGSPLQPLWGAEVRLTHGGSVTTRTTDMQGKWSAPVPAGDYTVQVSDPHTASFVAQSVAGELASGELDVVDVTLQPDFPKALPWAPCAADEAGPCVEALTATRNGTTTPGVSSDAARFAVNQWMPYGGVAWGPSQSDTHTVSIGWTLPGLGASGAPLNVAAVAQVPPPWTSGTPLFHQPRKVNAYLSVQYGSQLPRDVTFSLTLRGVSHPKVVVGLMQDAVVTSAPSPVSATGTVTMTGAPVRIVDGPIEDRGETLTDPSQIRERIGWYVDVMDPSTFPCSASATTTMTLMTNSFSIGTPQVQDGALLFRASGSHFDHPYDPAVRKVNDSGYYQVALPKAFVERADATCLGWGKPLAEAATTAHATVVESGQRQQVSQTAEVRQAQGGDELVVTVSGFHFSTPTIEVRPQAPASAAVTVGAAAVGEPAAGDSASLQFPVVVDTRSIPSGQSTRVCFTTERSASTATPGSDFTPLAHTSGNCSDFASGQVHEATRSVVVLADDMKEGDEQVRLTALDGLDRAAPVFSEAVGTISDHVPTTADPDPAPSQAPTSGDAPAQSAQPAPAPVVESLPSPAATQTPTPTPTPTPTGDATPSAPASETPDAQPSSPATGSSPSASPAAPTPPRLEVVDRQVVAGQRAAVVVHGAPGQVVELLGYSRPSTTYRPLRTAALDSNGRAVFALEPRTNTRLVARLAGQPATTGDSAVVTVAPRITLAAVRTGAKQFRFSGSASASTAGQRVRLFRVAGARLVLTAEGFTGRDGVYGITRRFTGEGQHAFLTTTGATTNNVAGRSGATAVTIR